ncbi:hypothetical protein FHU41_001344 [Psychromicrobium silvestre]|uniref:UBP-type domain-containing protein n=1 Tax=Psychromicrobium silvestre TaxID=1645614 RepID=A0A7Y9LT46_9MICC|nr:UBP-type zinc finger domain-containing protein [Psychromicrobium silvestre]NYE95123.1 hypothetical protein [Psychromicrobium silvestre]
MASDLIPGINPQAEPSGTGCAECLAEDGWWVHLRRCAECGHIGCCDTSPAQHASAHAGSSGHQIITSFEPGESWFYDFSTDELTRGPRLADPQSHPDEQPAPGPEGKVPENWEDLIHR